MFSKVDLEQGRGKILYSALGNLYQSYVRNWGYKNDYNMIWKLIF